MALLARDPPRAERQAREILKFLPDDARALFIVAAARRRQGDAAAARSLLERLTAAHPDSACAFYELGLTLASQGESEAALAALRRAANLQRDVPRAWASLSDYLLLAGDAAAAATARAEHCAGASPDLQAAVDALRANRLPAAVALLQRHLRGAPNDVAALQMLGETASRLGHQEDAEVYLARCVALAPEAPDPRFSYAQVLHAQLKVHEARAALDRLLAAAPEEPKFLFLAATCAILAGDLQGAASLAAKLIAIVPEQPYAWLCRGQISRMTGKAAESVADFRHALRLNPALGEAWWFLADLKTTRFTDAEIDLMRGHAENAALNASNRVHLHYALGKALEDRADWEASFVQYARGAALYRAGILYDADRHTAAIQTTTAEQSAPFFAARAEGGHPSGAPIFIVGLPRAGSTLVEQILARHPLVEATMELPDLVHIASALGRPGRQGIGPDFFEALAALDAEGRHALGAEYLACAARYRRLNRPRFTDKLPANYLNVGLIRLILPHARIIDVRRQPLAACFANFKQHFAGGQEFSYTLGELGRHYRDYAALMAHWDNVLPGFVHRLIYEELVADPEREIRRLLDFCGLDFAPACLRHWEGGGVVMTHSSEQVRTPIFSSSVDRWRNYAPWLGALEAALG
jgi:predicted Zn-dependent protease